MQKKYVLSMARKYGMKDFAGKIKVMLEDDILSEWERQFLIDISKLENVSKLQLKKFIEIEQKFENKTKGQK